MSGCKLPFSEYIVELCARQAHSCVIYFIHLFPMQFCMHIAQCIRTRSECFISGKFTFDLFCSSHFNYSLPWISIHLLLEFGTIKTQLFNKLFKVGIVFFFFVSSHALHSLMECEMLQLYAVHLLFSRIGISQMLYGSTLIGMCFFFHSLFCVYSVAINIASKTNWNRVSSKLDAVLEAYWKKG